MPVKRVALDDLETEVAEIEKQHRIVSVSPVGDGAAIVTYEPRGRRSAPGDRETR